MIFVYQIYLLAYSYNIVEGVASNSKKKESNNIRSSYVAVCVFP